MGLFDLSPVESRVLGCLLEKERLTPENYPLTLNSLITACNQSTNRDPVVCFDERTVEDGVNGLREGKLATLLHMAGSRVPKYRHQLMDHLNLTPGEVALLCVLLLRGPQTPGELRARTERMHTFATLEDMEEALESLTTGKQPLVRLLPARPGQKERRYMHLLSGEPDPNAGYHTELPARVVPMESREPKDSARIQALEAEVARLSAQLKALEEEFHAFKAQF